MGILLAQNQVAGRGFVSLHQGDLTLEDVDAIVNAANSHLAHGGGVAGAIVRRGGSSIQQESSELVNARGPVPAGGAVWTGPGSLKARGIVHAVGPRWGEGDEPAKLRRAAESAFAVATEHGCRTIALPAISSGIFGFPKPDCARILVDAAVAHLESAGARLEEIRFTLIDEETVGIFKEELVRRFGPECLVQE